MDEELAAIYGTGSSATEDDIEKVAAAEMLDKLAEAEGVDLNDFSDDEILGMISELSHSTKTASAQQEEEEVTDEAQEKLAEADFLGRVMAHSMHQELENIQKEALSTGEIGMKARHLAKKFPGVSDILAGSATRKGGRSVVEGARTGAAKAVSRSGIPTRQQGRAVSKLQNLIEAGGKKTMRGGSTQIAKGVGKGAATVGGVGLAAYGAKKALEKESSALETLAEERAYEMLQEAGYGYEETKEASAVDQHVDTMALQMLENAGYPVDWDQ